MQKARLEPWCHSHVVLDHLDFLSLFFPRGTVLLELANNLQVWSCQGSLYYETHHNFYPKIELHPNAFQFETDIIFMLFSLLVIGILISMAVFLSNDASAQAQTNDIPNKSINVTNTNFTINYNNTGDLKILSAKTDVQAKSLVMTIQSTKDGLLTVTLPRELIDRKDRIGDTPFFYVIGGYLSGEAQENSDTSTQRTITIPFMQGTNLLVISGTQIAPEFGSFAGIVIVIAITGIIIISTRSKIIRKV